METKEMLKSGGIFTAEHWSYFNEDGSINLGDDGLPLRRLVGVSKAVNKIVDQGLNYLNNVALYTTTKLSNAWYLALVLTNTTPIAGLTYAVPTYTESSHTTARQACTFATSASQVITNTASPAVFTLTSGASETEYGACLVGANASGVTTMGDTAASGGTLFSFGLFGTPRAVVATDIVNLTYSCTSASST